MSQLTTRDSQGKYALVSMDGTVSAEWVMDVVVEQVLVMVHELGGVFASFLK